MLREECYVYSYEYDGEFLLQTGFHFSHLVLKKMHRNHILDTKMKKNHVHLLSKL